MDRPTLEAAIIQALPADMGENIMPTIAESWIEEGRQEGELRSTRRILLKLLRQRFGPLPEAVEQRVAEADPVTLDRWLDEMLTAPSLASLFPGC